MDTIDKNGWANILIAVEVTESRKNKRRVRVWFIFGSIPPNEAGHAVWAPPQISGSKMMRLGTNGQKRSRDDEDSRTRAIDGCVR